jgi:hypothetical protein
MAENRMVELPVSLPDIAEISACSPPVRENRPDFRPERPMEWKTVHPSWKRLPRTFEEVMLRSLGMPDPLAGYGVPCPYPSLNAEVEA